ncbi:MAG: hypothetical protein CMI63_05795 [Parvularcula sp.]|nr:hypothetical protein [Parvularcula sp.]
MISLITLNFSGALHSGGSIPFRAFGLKHAIPPVENHGADHRVENVIYARLPKSFLKLDFAIDVPPFGDDHDLEQKLRISKSIKFSLTKRSDSALNAILFTAREVLAKPEIIHRFVKISRWVFPPYWRISEVKIVDNLFRGVKFVISSRSEYWIMKDIHSDGFTDIFGANYQIKSITLYFKPNSINAHDARSRALFSIQHLKRRVGSFFSFCERFLSNAKSQRDIDNPRASNKKARDRRTKHRQGPLGHIPLGVKVCFLAPLIAFGLWFGYRGFRAKSPTDGAIILIAGSIVAAIAVTLIIA